MKNKLLLAVVVFLFSGISAHAFGLKLGLTGGYNLSSTYFTRTTWLETLKGKTASGWFVGPKVDMELLLGLYLDGALVYDQREFKFSQSGGLQRSEKLNSIDFPVNVKYRFAISGIGIYASTGPQFSYAVGNRNWTVENLLNKDNNKVSTVFKTDNLTTTWNFGVGIVLLRHLEVGLGYNVAIGELGKSTLKNAGISTGNTKLPSYRLNTFNVQATYLF